MANRLELAQAKLAHNFIQNSTHPLQQYIDSELHPTHRRGSRLWGSRFAGALRKLSTPPATATPDVIVSQVALTPPARPRAKPSARWTPIQVTALLNDHLPSKHRTEAELLKTLTLAILDQLTIDKPVFYTDGSVMESKVAAAAVHKDISTQLRLNDGASILQAELVAIREAIYIATRANYNTACILSNSKAAIQAIDSIHPHDNKHLIKSIHEAVRQLHTPPVIAWIPSHIGIPGNESADLAAKDALNRAHPDVYISTSNRQTNATLTLNATAIYKVQTATQPSASCDRNISLSITHEQHKALWEVIRHILKNIHKLRTFQRTRGQIIDNDNQCYYCEGNFAHYTDHYILHCPATRRYRERLYIDIQHHQGNTSTRTSNIMKTQAERHAQKLTTLIRKCPIMQ